MVSRGNVVETAIRDAWLAAGAPRERCAWLRANRDSFARKDYNRTAKAWGCRRRRSG